MEQTASEAPPQQIPQEEPRGTPVCYERRPEGFDDTPADFDEVIARGVSDLHIERMDDRGIWMGITLTDGHLYHVNFWNTGRGVLLARMEDEGMP